jgi:hypothetical protein
VKTKLFILLFISVMLISYCSPPEEEIKKHPLTDGTADNNGLYTGYTFIDSVYEFNGTESTSFGKDKALNGVRGKGDDEGSLDVFVVGEGKEVIFKFSDKSIVNKTGVDFKVFENGFFVSGSDNIMSLDLATVSVSLDGNIWYDFPVNYNATYPDNSCNGKDGFVGLNTVSLNFDDNVLIDPKSDLAGGDAFDLSDAGLSDADFIKYIKITDGGSTYPDGQFESNGVDIDGICGFYWVMD